MRVGIIGAGAMARIHGAAWNKLPVTLTGCYDRHPERAEAFCHQFGGKPYTSLEELLPDIDVLTICTHTDGHKEAVLAAAKSRVAIVCEKPLARHVRDAEEIVEVCEATNTPLYVAQVVRFFPAYAKAHAAVAAGQIGRPGVIHTTRAGAFPRSGGAFSSPFYADFARSGGVMLDLAVHDIDFHRWVGGDVDRVFARRVDDSQRTNRDHAFITLRFKNGAIGHIDASWALPPGQFRTSLEIAGDEGLIEWSSLQQPPLQSVRIDDDDEPQIAFSSPLAAHDEPFFAQLAHVYDALTMGKPFRVSPRDGLMAVKVALAAIHSATTNRPVDVNTFVDESTVSGRHHV